MAQRKLIKKYLKINVWHNYKAVFTCTNKALCRQHMECWQLQESYYYTYIAIQLIAYRNYGEIIKRLPLHISYDGGRNKVKPVLVTPQHMEWNRPNLNNSLSSITWYIPRTKLIKIEIAKFIDFIDIFHILLNSELKNTWVRHTEYHHVSIYRDASSPTTTLRSVLHDSGSQTP